MEKTRDEWAYYSVFKCPIGGNAFMSTVIFTDNGLRVALEDTGSKETPRLVAVNGQRILPKKWYRRNVVSHVSVGDSIVVAMPDGTEASHVVREIQSWFRWEDFE